MNAILSLQTLELEETASEGNSGLSAGCTSASGVSYNCGGSTKFQGF
ncbi:hypothetical protein [Solilutibacter silvestris]|uniref:Uncharacterized protein n=1 Tax=Solilutibacter silvestris TaxID=1645665 RepID=A0A2K1Q1Q3_9GAMM|nr:hypothetical protein [Lysobacter silvestris]PNS08857.1 hypothetical protein Lysil_0486 [Lysobacter silvestris]